jgi:surface antigen
MRFTGRLLPRAVLVVLLAVVATLLVLPRGQAAVLGDDYPSNLKAKGKDAMVDPWRFYNRECTSFVAWRVTSADGFSAFNDYWLTHWGNASNWKAAAQTSAVEATGVTVDNTPTVGAVAWWSAHSVGSSVGHVAWVAVVNSTSITIEEYNYLHEGYYDTRTITKGSSYWPGAFLHFPPKTLTSTAKPTISGTAKVGDSVKASTGSWSTTGLTFSYQWLDNGTPIAKAVHATFPVGASRAGHRLSVQVTAAKSGLKSVTATSPSTAVVLPGDLTTTAAPTVTGSPKVGVALTAVRGTWSPVPRFAYQWYAGGEAISGATGTTFTPGVDQVSTPITVTVTGIKNGYTSHTATSAATAHVAPGTLVNSVDPTISGTPQVGESVTASPGSWSPSAAYSYQWRADGTKISGATGQSYTPTSTQSGTALSVTVTASTAGYSAASVTSSAATVKEGRFTPDTAPHLRSTGQVGRKISVDAGTWDPKPTAIHYQWLRGTTKVGSDTSAFTPSPAAVGKDLSVQVTVSRAGYATQTLTTAATTVAPGVLTAEGLPVVSGEARKGSTLAATTVGWNVPGAHVGYQWYADSTPIAHATKKTLVLTDTEVGHHVHVVETATSAGYTKASTTSASTTSVVYGSVTIARRPTITGSRVYGHTLTAHDPETSPAATTITWQWYRGHDAIAHATSASYLQTEADVGRQVWVRARASATSWISASEASSGTSVTRTPSTVAEKPAFGGVTGRLVTLAITIAAPGAQHVYGDIVVLQGKHRLAKGHVHAGHVRLTLGTLAAGKHHLTITYAGTPVVGSQTRKVTVRVP